MTISMALFALKFKSPRILDKRMFVLNVFMRTLILRLQPKSKSSLKKAYGTMKISVFTKITHEKSLSLLKLKKN